MRPYELSPKLASLLAKNRIPANAPTYVVDAIGLSEDRLGYPRFPQELVARREWCADHCNGRYEIEPIRDRRMRLVGRRFKFEDEVDAVFFKLRWGAEVR